MTTYDYYSIPLRMGLLILVLACVAIANMALSLGDVMDSNTFKCVIAMWTLLGCVGMDISKNGFRHWKRQMSLLKYQAQSLLRAENEIGIFGGAIDPRARGDCK
jgi:hypothetical protein